MRRKKCPNCGAWMNSNYETFWDCDECGETVVKPGYSSDYKDTDEKIPKACEACGGPYPQCTTSCKLFDD